MTSPNTDGFVAKLSPAGKVLWAVQVGDSGTQQDSLVMRFSADKSTIELVATLGGTGTDGVDVVALGPKGNIYVAGGFKDAFKAGSTTATAVDDSDVYVAKLTSAGAVSWAVTGGGKGKDTLKAMVVDSNGDAYVGGSIGIQVSGPVAPFKIGTKSVQIGSWGEALLAKITSSGSVSWAKQASGTNVKGGNADEYIRGLALDASGRLIVAAQLAMEFDFFGKTLKAPDAYGGWAAVLGRVDTSGEAQWAVAYGDAPYKNFYSTAVAVDSQGDIVLTGRFKDLITLGGTTLSSKGTTSDIFVHKTTPPK